MTCTHAALSIRPALRPTQREEFVLEISEDAPLGLPTPHGWLSTGPSLPGGAEGASTCCRRKLPVWTVCEPQRRPESVR